MTTINWKDAVKTCVNAAVRNGKVQVVCSPDVDGVVSFFLLQEYLKKQFVRATLVGEYDSEQLLLYKYDNKPTEDIQNIIEHALFLDLDIRFAPHAIGQHFLGNVSIPKDTYFNPNVFFDIHEHGYTSKYPFGTAQLLMWALFDETEFSTFKHPYSLAQSLFVHADSTYMNCKAYKRNATNWACRLFNSVEESPPSLQRLLSGEYYKNGSKVHNHVLNDIQAHVQGGGFTENDFTFDRYVGHQVCSSTKDVFALLDVCAKYFRREKNMENIVPSNTVVGWKGELRKVKRHLIKDMGVFLEQNSVQSHAQINLRNVSCTFGTNPTFVASDPNLPVQDECL
jgi:hypothetical protein